MLDKKYEGDFLKKMIPFDSDSGSEPEVIRAVQVCIIDPDNLKDGMYTSKVSLILNHTCDCVA